MKFHPENTRANPAATAIENAATASDAPNSRPNGRLPA